MKNNNFFKLTIIISVFTLTNCSLYQKPSVPTVDSPIHFKTKIQVKGTGMNNDWWKNFHDQQLNSLIEKAIKNNYNYQIAIKNIDIAKTYVEQYRSNLFPQVTLNYSGSRNKSRTVLNQINSVGAGGVAAPISFPKFFNLHELYGTVNYELDVWNQVGNTVNQAKANVDVSESDSDVIRLTLISSITTTYFQIITLNSNLTNLKMQFKITNKLLKLNNTQLTSGLIDGTTIDDLKNQLETLKSGIAAAEKQKQVLINTLAYLIGEYPENFNIHFSDQYNLTQFIPTNVSSKMIANRPDIQSAYNQIISYGYLEKQNIANFLPSLSLTGNYGYANTALANLISSPNSFWNYGLNALQPLLDFGYRKSLYDRSKIQFDSAVLSYKNTILNAFQEVDSALISYQQDHKSLIYLKHAVKNSFNKSNLSHAQFQSGYGDYSIYLTDQLAYLQNKYNYNNQQLSVTQDMIQFYKSLGLGLSS